MTIEELLNEYAKTERLGNILEQLKSCKACPASPCCGNPESCDGYGVLDEEEINTIDCLMRVAGSDNMSLDTREDAKKAIHAIVKSLLL